MTQEEAENIASVIVSNKAHVKIDMADWLDEESYQVHVTSYGEDGHNDVTITDPDMNKLPRWMCEF